MAKKEENKPLNRKHLYPKESKTDLFLRLAKPRTQTVIDKLRILGNCANKNSYEYTEEQIIAMFNAIQVAVNSTKDKFNESIQQKEVFEF